VLVIRENRVSSGLVLVLGEERSEIVPEIGPGWYDDVGLFDHRAAKRIEDSLLWHVCRDIGLPRIVIPLHVAPVDGGLPAQFESFLVRVFVRLKLLCRVLDVDVVDKIICDVLHVIQVVVVSSQRVEVGLAASESGPSAMKWRRSDILTRPTPVCGCQSPAPAPGRQKSAV
jgi:hypothetical protein